LSKKQKPGNSINSKELCTASTYTKEFRDQVVAVYNSGVYANMAECARSYKVPEKLFYQWISASRKQILPPE
jgi:transposase-like protein